MAQASVIMKAAPLPSAELNLGGTATTEKVFLNSAGTALVLPLPMQDLLPITGKLATFRIVAAGRVTGGSSAVTFIARMYWGTSTTVGSDTVIEVASTTTVTAVSAGWMIEGVYTFDTTSGKIDGWSQSICGGTTTLHSVAAKIDNTISSTSTPALSLTTTSLQGFVLSGQFGSNGQAANTAFVDVFQLEMVG